jgi:uncharacterized RDD family membrane protein YckC
VLKLLKRHRVYLSIMLILAFVLTGRISDAGVGMAMEQKNGVYTLFLSLPPLSFAVFALLCAAYATSMIRPSIKTIDTLPTAGIARRFASFFIDFFTNLFIAGVVTTAVALLINGYQSGDFAWHVARPYEETKDSIYVILFVLTVIAAIVLFALPVSLKKQSVGCSIMGMYIHSERRLSVFKSTLRTLVGYLTMCAALISVPMAWARKDRRMWHDKAFGTYPKRMKK